MEAKTVLDNSKNAGLTFGSATAGALTAGFLGSKIPDIEALKKIPGVGAILAQITPGLLLMLLAYIGSEKVDQKYAKTAFLGVGIGGMFDLLRRTGLLAKINAVGNTGVSGLKGLGIVQNFGAYSPDYFMMSNWATRPLNGPGDSSAFGLQGPEEKSFGLQGPESLQGLGCMFQ
jgi:hypothetical protein